MEKNKQRSCFFSFGWLGICEIINNGVVCFSFGVVTCWDLVQNKQKEWMFSLWVGEMSKRLNKGVGILFLFLLGC